MWIDIVLIPIQIHVRSWIGIKKEIRIRIVINTMPIHNTGYRYNVTIEPVSVVDPDSTGTLDPYSDPDSQSRSGSGSRRAKMIHKHKKKSAGCSLLRAEGFSCSLDVLYGGLGIR
jgi:hypothetical protein